MAQDSQIRRWDPRFIAAARIAAAILLAYLALGLLYSVASPLFEPSDEHNHYPFVQHLATGGGLPVQPLPAHGPRASTAAAPAAPPGAPPGAPTLWGQEGSQPPLYYALGALLTAPIPSADMDALLYRNPHDRRGVPGATDNVNLYIHTDREAFPWHGAALAVHLVRLFGVLLGAGTVLCTYLIGRRLFPDEPAIALTAMALNAFVPMFLFIGASVNNDNLVVFLASLALLMLVRVVQRGAAPAYLLGIGAVIGLACLSKLSALALLPLAGIALLLRRDWRAGKPLGRASLRWVADLALIGIPALLIAGWWYVRNWQLYRDPTGLNAMLGVAGGRSAPGSLGALLGELRGFFYSYWGVLGGFDILLQPRWVYAALGVLTLLALAGLAAWAWQVRRRPASLQGAAPPWRELALLGAWVLLEAAALVRWTSSTLASQGRLMFAAISAICVFLALGLLGPLRPRWRPYAGAAAGGLLFLLAASTPFTALLPAYAPAPLVTEAAVPATARPVNVDYGGAMRLLAFDAPASPLTPGSDVPVTLYWKVLKPIGEDLSLSVHLFGWRQDLDQVDTYPGGGTRPTSLLPAGAVLADRYVLHVPADAKGPAPAWLTAGVYRLSTMEPLAPTDASGKALVFPVLDKLTLETPVQTLKGSHPLDANLGNAVRLTGYDLSEGPIRPGQAVTTTLYWQSIAPLAGDYTVFVHIRDQAGKTVAQADAPPLQGFYPTSAWQPGEVLDDAHPVILPKDLPPGRYRIVIGLYDKQTGERLPVTDAAGQASGNEVPVGEVEVGAP